jgi:hypothetical protein
VDGSQEPAEGFPEGIVAGEFVHVSVERRDAAQQLLRAQELKNVLQYFCTLESQRVEEREA